MTLYSSCTPMPSLHASSFSQPYSFIGIITYNPYYQLMCCWLLFSNFAFCRKRTLPPLSCNTLGLFLVVGMLRYLFTSLSYNYNLSFMKEFMVLRVPFVLPLAVALISRSSFSAQVTALQLWPQHCPIWCPPLPSYLPSSSGSSNFTTFICNFCSFLPHIT